MRTVYWENNELKMIDQRELPAALVIAAFTDYRMVARAITDMVVRGAPAIGAAAAFGIALAARESVTSQASDPLNDLTIAAAVLKSTRPTAVNLAWAVDRVLRAVLLSANDEGIRSRGGPSKDIYEIALEEAQNIADEDVKINRRLSEYGSTLINDGDTIIHHCNTGSLATVEWGTALGVIRMAHEQGKSVHVLVDETRPRLQGARLTAWECEQYGIPYEIITDNMAGYFLQAGRAQKVIFGADRIVANGDTANKIGTYMLSLAARDNGVPVYVAAPTSTLDLTLAHGGLIPIEERAADEVLDIQFQGKSVVPQNAKARNPAFDITPNRLLTAIVTENGIIYPPFDANLPKYVHSS